MSEGNMDRRPFMMPTALAGMVARAAAGWSTLSPVGACRIRWTLANAPAFSQVESCASTRVHDQ
jgi:hypothetical protein